MQMAEQFEIDRQMICRFVEIAAGFHPCYQLQRLRVKGKGLVSKKQTGDLYAVLKIVMPPKPDENTAALWQQLADAQSSFDPRKDWGKA